MSAIRLRGATSGTTDLVAAAIAGDGVLTLPTGAGTIAKTTNLGLVPVAPTSIANSGGSASISANTTTFTTVTSVSLNGVFSSLYTNYRIVLECRPTTNDLSYRLRLTGTDVVGTNYSDQFMQCSGTTFSGGRRSAQTFASLVYSANNARVISAFDIGNPAVATTTSMLGSQVFDGSPLSVITIASLHDVATAYDGFTIFTPTGTVTGTVTIYGYNK